MGISIDSVLLIEDEDPDAILVQRALHRIDSGASLARTHSLEQALQLIEQQPFQLILTDLGLPDCSGIDAVGRLRAASSDATIIVLSGLEDFEARLRTLDSGAQDFLIKHEISPFTLQRAIEHGIHRLQNERRIRRLLDEVQTQKVRLEQQASQLDRQNRRLRKLYRTAQRFVNSVSHDFRTPLTIVREYATLIANGAVGKVQPEQVRMLKVMSDRVDDLNNMVDDMLDISRHNNGLLGANRQRCDIKQTLLRMLPGLQEKAALRGTELLITLPDELPFAYCDAEKVGRVFVNLLTNAIKFTHAGGVVHVRADEVKDQKEIRITVQDDGEGISERECSAIFRRFRQSRSGIQNTSKGFGLGLSIAKELVDLNLGQMSIESEVGVGSTFGFTVPIDEPVSVTRRYLSRLQDRSRGKADVSFVMAETEPIDQKNADDVRRFLTLLHRSRDLVIDAGPGRWLVMLCCHELQVKAFLDRAEQQQRELMSHRTLDPLPVIQFRHLGTRRSSESIDLMMGQVHAWLDTPVAEPQRACHVGGTVRPNKSLSRNLYHDPIERAVCDPCES